MKMIMKLYTDIIRDITRVPIVCGKSEYGRCPEDVTEILDSQ